ncbi:DUF6069 family protein [Kibdelosporangium aridum]|uniref:Uncharacterized protein n=1 Tax=Kibdelosporangium aridum TaxID=2030 RepID=A0A1Y5Y947_KIBAR|nr:DUF6069 family protein [Kibdelosporangium aridum]SMD27106.1 hypothetical protein SAMN05661093_10703 [Kibdelosporangium aridum]
MTTSISIRGIAIRLGVAALIALAANTAIALAARQFDDGGIGAGLVPAQYLSLTLIGIVLGAVGWTVVSRYAPRALRVVVPVVLVLTWIPDVLLLNSGATAGNVVGLMLMHVVVAIAVVAAFRGGTRRQEEASSPL